MCGPGVAWAVGRRPLQHKRTALHRHDPGTPGIFDVGALVAALTIPQEHLPDGRTWNADSTFDKATGGPL